MKISMMVACSKVGDEPTSVRCVCMDGGGGVQYCIRFVWLLTPAVFGVYMCTYCIINSSVCVLFFCFFQRRALYGKMCALENRDG